MGVFFDPFWMTDSFLWVLVGVFSRRPDFLIRLIWLWRSCPVNNGAVVNAFSHDRIRPITHYLIFVIRLAHVLTMNSYLLIHLVILDIIWDMDVWWTAVWWIGLDLSAFCWPCDNSLTCCLKIYALNWWLISDPTMLCAFHPGCWSIRLLIFDLANLIADPGYAHYIQTLPTFHSFVSYSCSPTICNTGFWIRRVDDLETRRLKCWFIIWRWSGCWLKWDSRNRMKLICLPFYSCILVQRTFYFGEHITYGWGNGKSDWIFLLQHPIRLSWPVDGEGAQFFYDRATVMLNHWSMMRSTTKHKHRIGSCLVTVGTGRGSTTVAHNSHINSLIMLTISRCKNSNWLMINVRQMEGNYELIRHSDSGAVRLSLLNWSDSSQSRHLTTALVDQWSVDCSHPTCRNLSVIYTNSSLVPNICSSQYFNRFAERYRLCLRTTQPNFGVHPGLVLASSSRRLQLRRALHGGTPSAETSNLQEFKELNLEGEPSAKEINLNKSVVEERSDISKNEILRRKKIALANKGRVPWNKGKKHTAETRELISQRTKEALKDPKVRKKMSECPRTLSDQTKEKIRKTITRQWRKRLKLKKSRERFISAWAESIANAAKKGGHGERELDWDSYEKIEREIALQQLQRSADVAKAKEMAQMRAQRRARAKAEKAKLTLQKRMAKVKGLAKKKRPTKRSKEEKDELAAAEDLKLKERLTKIRRKKSVNDQLSSRDHRAWERLDLEFLKKDTRKDDVSLADQIRDVKNKKAEVFITGVPNHRSD